MEEKKISVKELVKHITTKMSAEEALEILLASQIKHYEKLKLDKQPADNPETISPYYIIIAATLDMGWGVVVEDNKDIVRGLCIGTNDYLEEIFKIIQNENTNSTS